MRILFIPFILNIRYSKINVVRPQTITRDAENRIIAQNGGFDFVRFLL